MHTSKTSSSSRFKTKQTYIIAEAGVNHNGDLQMAKQLIDVAASAKADAVKFQTFEAEKLANPQTPHCEYVSDSQKNAESHYEMLRRLELSREDHIKLIGYSQSKGIDFISTPFHEEAVDLLHELNVPVFKLPSGEVTNLPFLKYAASKNRPIILSTGMTTLAEVEAAVQTIASTGNTKLSLLHCVSNYPSQPEETNLRAMNTLRCAFGVPVGLSDHSMGNDIAVASVALGATIVEKHITLDRSLPGPDHKASLEPQELHSLVQSIRNVEKALGNGIKQPVSSEQKVKTVARKSLVASENIPPNTKIERGMLIAKRPGNGISPAEIDSLTGRTTAAEIAAGTQISWDLLQ